MGEKFLGNKMTIDNAKEAEQMKEKEMKNLNVEIHMLQNFTLTNLNRDLTNAPKMCQFGGVKRSRVSSQCKARATRMHQFFIEAIREAQGDLGVRTKRLAGAIARELAEEILVDNDFRSELGLLQGKTREEIQRIAEEKVEPAANVVLHLIGLTPKGANETDDDNDTDDQESTEQQAEYLLYVGKGDITSLAKIAAANRKKLDDLAKRIDAAVRSQETTKAGKAKKKVTRKTIEKLEGFEDLEKLFKPLLKRKDQKGKPAYAADIALRGRMIANDKDMNVDSASQIAHMIGTNKLRVDSDFFTAVDDLLPSAESGAAMMGDLGMTSACYYSYANVDVRTLYENLGNNVTLLKATIKGFLQSFYGSFPSGKQNCTAGFNYPCYVRIVVKGKNLPMNLANAFQKPVVPDVQSSLEEASIMAFENRLEQERKMHGALAGFDSIITERVATIYQKLVKDTNGRLLTDSTYSAIEDVCNTVEKEYADA
jgi:CRISPR system Cascade subunit CasC